MPSTLAFLTLLAHLGVSSAQGGSWVLTFEDDFNGDALNRSNWTPKNYSTQDGGYALFTPDRVSVSQGNLVITTGYIPGGGVWDGVPYNFTSGWVDSQNKFSQRNGRFEAHAMLPVNNASCAWPAWWLLPNPEASCWPIGGEVDIFEGWTGGHYQHNNPKTGLYSIASTYHWGFECYKDCQHYPGQSRWFPNMSDTSAPLVNFTGEYHTFGAEINDTAIRFYVDDNTTFVMIPTPQSDPSFQWGNSTYAPFSELFGILNTAVSPEGDGCFASGWWLNNNATMLVDWVRVYQWVPACNAELNAHGGGSAAGEL